MYIAISIVVLFFLSGIRIVRPFEKGLHERFGKFIGERPQGFIWIIPIVDRLIKVDITENMVDVPPQKVITSDKLNTDVDAVVYFRVIESKKAIYNAQNYKKQITSLARTTLRALIGQMTLADANSKRSEINNKLATQLENQTKLWGIDIIRVELQRIEPPENVQNAMNEVVEAENKKISAVNFANATETQADGKRRASIKEAEGDAFKVERLAKAKAEQIKLENEAIQKYFKNEAQIFKKLETTENSLSRGTKYVIDPNSKITNVISDMAGVVPIDKR